jgi:hypothetical protein
VARAVDVRASDLPAGWKKIPDSPGGKDSLSWVVVCARDAGVSPGTLSGADTPDFSPTGTSKSSQVGSATGLFGTEAAAAAYVNLFRNDSVGRCMAAEAIRAWPDSFSGAVRAFGPRPLPVSTATEAAGLVTTARSSNGTRVVIQFFAIRTGPIVTMLDTLWMGDGDNRILGTVASKIGTRQHAA